MDEYQMFLGAQTWYHDHEYSDAKMRHFMACSLAAVVDQLVRISGHLEEIERALDAVITDPNSEMLRPGLRVAVALNDERSK